MHLTAVSMWTLYDIHNATALEDSFFEIIISMTFLIIFDNADHSCPFQSRMNSLEKYEKKTNPPGQTVHEQVDE